MGRLGIDFVDEGRLAPMAAPCRAALGVVSRATTTAAGALAAALGVAPVVARLLCQRGLGDPERRDALPEPVARSPARSDAAGRHGAWPSIASWRRSRGGSGSPSTATTTSTASPRPSSCGARSSCSAPTSSTSSPSGCGRLRPAAGGDRAAARRGRRADRLGRLRHPRRRGGAAGARARRRPDHHRPSRAGRRAAAGAGRHQPEAPRLHVSGQEPGRRRRRAEAGAGALPRGPAARAGCRASSRSPPSARWPTSCRSSARTASSRSSASTCCRAGRTRSAARAARRVRA